LGFLTVRPERVVGRTFPVDFSTSGLDSELSGIAFGPALSTSGAVSVTKLLGLAAAHSGSADR
jgi:spore maturation protein SpmB